MSLNSPGALKALPHMVAERLKLVSFCSAGAKTQLRGA